MFTCYIYEAGVLELDDILEYVIKTVSDLSSYRKKCLRAFFVHGRHGNAEIHMRTKFHFHALHGLKV